MWCKNMGGGKEIITKTKYQKENRRPQANGEKGQETTAIVNSLFSYAALNNLQEAESSSILYLYVQLRRHIYHIYLYIHIIYYIKVYTFLNRSVTSSIQENDPEEEFFSIFPGERERFLILNFKVLLYKISLISNTDMKFST